MAGLTMNEGWTVDDSIAEFEGTGFPVEEYRFRKAIQAFRIRPVGEKRPPEDEDHGGRGHGLYDIADMQELHKDFIRWRERQERHAGTRER
jgi:hypothetical protein